MITDGVSVAYSTVGAEDAAAPGGYAVYILNLQTHESVKVPGSEGLESPLWSPDKQYLYYEDLLEPGEPIYRILPTDTHAERVTDFAAVLATGATRYQFVGFAPDGSVMAVIMRGGGEVYALELNLP